MKKKKIRLGTRRKVLFAVALAGMLMGAAGCSEKETLSLDSEDLVRLEGADEGGSMASGTGAGGVLEENGEGRGEVSGGISAGGRSAGENGEGAVAAGNGMEALEENKERVEKSTLFVHICGEVVKPGVYELPEGSRVYEAVEEAGGFTKDAASDYVNLAYILEDGWKIEIPSLEKLEKEGEEKSAGVSAGISADAGRAITEDKTDTFGGNGAGDGLVDINTATRQELITLPGVGESRAESIISYREKNGGFSRIEDIMKVEGIKEGMFAKMKDKICVRGVK